MVIVSNTKTSKLILSSGLPFWVIQGNLARRAFTWASFLGILLYEMLTQFHLSIGVKSIHDSVDFFTRVLMAKVQHRDPSGYVNIDFFGTQITLKENVTILLNLPDFHFGVNLALPDFELLSRNILEQDPKSVFMLPKVVDSGSTLERKKMYVKCPTGYLIEIKGYRIKT